MKKSITMFIICFSLITRMYSQTKIDEGMQYYFNKLIPNYYSGQQSFYDEESYVLLKNYGFHMQGDGFSQIENTKTISFSFYLLLEHAKQDVQVVKISQKKLKIVYMNIGC